MSQPSKGTGSTKPAAATTGAGKLTAPVVNPQATGGKVEEQKVGIGLVGACPTITVGINDMDTTALLDTGSEVTTVTHRWVAQNLGEVMLKATHLKLRAVNGAEVPYSGILVVDMTVFGSRIAGVPVLVVPEPTDPAMRERKRKVPLLIGMNVLGECLASSRSSVPEGIRAAVQEVKHVSSASTKGVARTAGQSQLVVQRLHTIHNQHPLTM